MKAMDGWERARFVFEAVVALVAVLGAWMLVEQIRLTRRVLHSAERPWLTAEIDMPAPRELSTDTAIRVVIANAGRSPAVGVSGEIAAAVADNDVPFPEAPKFPNYDQRASTATLAPSQRSWLTKGLTPETVLQHRQHGKRLYVYGRIKYRDSLEDDTHQTTFCYFLEPGVAWTACERYLDLK